MNWEPEPESYPYSNGQNPTPTATPTSASASLPMDLATFETPKAAFSHFDAQFPWGTSPLQDLTSPFHHSLIGRDLFKHPDASDPASAQLASFSPTQSRPLGRPEDPDTEIVAHSKYLSQEMKPEFSQTRPVRHPSQSSSLSPQKFSPVQGAHQDNPADCITNTAFSNEQLEQSARTMQTPPTSSHTTRTDRIGKVLDQNGLPVHPAEPIFQLPEDLGALTPSWIGENQDSRDVGVMLEFQNNDHVSQISFANDKLFWDPESGTTDGQSKSARPGEQHVNHSHSLQSANARGWNSAQSGGQSNPVASTGMRSVDTSARQFQFRQSSGFDYEASNLRSDSSRLAKSRAGANTAKSTGSGSRSAEAVNPNLLTSFTTSPENQDWLSNRQDRGQVVKLNKPTRQPYQHQFEESKRETEQNIGHRTYQRPDLAGPDLRHNQDRSGLKRSMTDSSVRRSSHKRLGRSPPSKYNRLSVEGTHSLFKAVMDEHPRKQGHQENPRSVPRPAVTFSIDASGRAKTETKFLLRQSGSRPLDTSSSSRHDELDDIDTESSTDDDLTMVTSRNSSFTFPEGTDTRPRIARSATESFANSGASNSFVDRATLGRPSSFLENGSWKKWHARRHSHIGPSGPSDILPFQIDDAESEAETELDDIGSQGDAQHALRELVEKRARNNDKGRKNHASPGYSYTDPPDSHKFSGSISQRSRHLSGLPGNINISPTTITDPDFATPSTDRDSLSSEGTRCVCDSSDSGGHLMIQCDSCSRWLHVKCVGLNRKALPPVYVCVYCTGLTPVVRGGRIRQHIRTNPALASSPLAHKANKNWY